MLSKVLKHEFLASIKILGIVFGGSLVLSGLTNVAYAAVGSNFLSNLLMTISVLGITAVVISSLAILCGRFNSAILGKEAYFTFTLPVKNYVHILARVINTAIFTLLAAVVVFVDILFLFGMENMSFLFVSGEEVSIIMFVVCLILVGAFTAVMEIYAALTLGTMFTKNRIGGMILSMFIFSTVTSIVSSILVLPFTSLIDDLMNFIIGGGGSVSSRLWVLFAVLAALCAVMSGIYYLITWYVSCRRLKVGDN